MTLKELIDFLASADQDYVVPLGFSSPHSYRGVYCYVAFEPTANIKVCDMLEAVRSAIGPTFEGWKGGDFNYSDHTPAYLARRGHCGEEIGHVLLDYMLGVVGPGGTK